MVAKLFVPSVRCPKCSRANDIDFRYCQCCGYQRHVVGITHQTPIQIDLSRVDSRLEHLMNYDRTTNYSKQKESLQRELEAFLSALPNHVTLATATPHDVCRFLVFKDRNGKTQVHVIGCSFLGQRGQHSCGCPVRLSYKTVDSYIGKLRAIFHANGRDGQWDPRLSLGNPAADKLVKDYLKAVTREQLQARITAKQATPFFVDKLTQLAEHLQRLLTKPGLSPIQRFIVARDQAYFKTVFFSGDRPADLGQIKVQEILRFPNDDGFLFNHVWGKTLRDGDENVFGIRRNPQGVICPIKAIEQYMDIARQLSIDLTDGYLFRPSTPSGGIQNVPFTSSAAESRLRVYLKEMGSDNGETLHGFRSGCAITLALRGAELSEIMDHVGWTRRHTALYYMQLAKVLNPSGASARLALTTSDEATNAWEDLNQLRKFVTAFPVDNVHKRASPQELNTGTI